MLAGAGFPVKGYKKAGEAAMQSRLDMQWG